MSSWGVLAVVVILLVLAFAVAYMQSVWSILDSRFFSSQSIEETMQSRESASVSSSILSIYEQDHVRMLTPIVKYELDNGTVITVYKKNPFPFDIKVSPSVEVTVPSTLAVYRAVLLRSSEEVFKLASRLGIDTSKLFFNNATKTYIFYNETRVFEYRISNGYMRLVLKTNPGTSQGSFPSDEVLVSKALEYLKAKKLLYMNDYRVRVGNYLIFGNGSVVKAVVFKAVLRGIEAENLGLTVLLNSKGEVVGLKGVVPVELEAVGEYRVKQLDQIVEELKAKIRTGAPMTDWYIDWLAFTELSIEDVAVKYHLNTAGYLIPVFVIKGSYTLDYDGIHDSGQIKAVIVAVESS